MRTVFTIVIAISRVYQSVINAKCESEKLDEDFEILLFYLSLRL